MTETRTTKTGMEIATGWYHETEIADLVKTAGSGLYLAAPKIPEIGTDEFVTWLTNHLRQSMAKGIQLGRGESETKLAAIREHIETIVCTEGIDAGVVLLSSEGPTHFDPEMKCQVYDHEYFSPLGDALIALHNLTIPN